MKVAIAAHMVGNRPTGVGRYVTCLVDHLTQIAPESEFHLILGAQQRHALAGFERKNLITHSLPLPAGIGIKQHFLMSHLVNELSVDCFHYPHFDMSWFVRSRSVVTIHDLKYQRHPQFFPVASKRKRLAQKVLMKRAVNRADRIIAISDFTKRDLEEAFQVPESRIDVVHHGVVTPTETTAAASPEAPYLLCVAERRPHKNLEVLIEAFGKLTQRIPNLELVIVGQSYSHYQGPEACMERLQLQNKVRLVEDASDEKLFSLYRGAAAFVLPSHYEGFGFPILEAMKAETPVVCSHATALPEISNGAAILVQPESTSDWVSAIEQVLTDRELRGWLVRHGKIWADQFTWERCARETLKVYQRAMEPSNA